MQSGTPLRNGLATTSRWGALALGLVLLAVAGIQWPEPAEPGILAYRSVSDEAFSMLRRQAFQFVEDRARKGFEFSDGPPAPLSFRIQCKGALVMHVERQPSHLLIRVPLEAQERAPEISQLLAELRQPLQPLPYLEQVMADVGEPVLMDRLLHRFAGNASDASRCVGQGGATAKVQSVPKPRFMPMPPAMH